MKELAEWFEDCVTRLLVAREKSFITLTQGWNQLSKKLREWAVLVSFLFN